MNKGYSKEIEPGILTYWQKNKIYEKSCKKNKGKTKFYFLQGPPYTSGRIHAGQAWNNSLKDIALRYKRMKGFDVWDRAGYDMHGLPTENKVQSILKLNIKKDIVSYGVDKFIKECIKFSSEGALQMNNDLQRLGIWFDYENAYWPIKNAFMEGEWWFIKRAHEKKRIYKGKKVMTWCASCETALAKHELEYKTIKDDSVFLKFKIKNKENEFLVVWTTTPWTIPFNLAVMVNPELEYVKAKVENEIWITAKALVGPLVRSVAGKDFEIIEEFKGDKLKGTEYEHPLQREITFFKTVKSPHLHTVVLNEEYVDASAGSGLVHCAPGCGPEDFEVGAKHELPPFNQIDERGIFFGMGKFSRFVARKDDKKFVEELDKINSLIAVTQVEHEYPHCWRCKNPVVFRTTEQWFMKVEDLKDEIMAMNKNVYWYPPRGKDIFNAWVSNLKDNSITRQRFWGTPVPIWECGECNKITVVGSADELAGISTTKLPNDLHKPWIDEVKVRCKCGEKISRIPDVIDVWIDSGTTSFTSLGYPKIKEHFEKLFPADLILEATEQVRLWFSMLAICSAIAFDKSSYKNVYMHGMLFDYQGMKMSKSLGNIISPYEVIDKYGADVLRVYMCGVAAGENMNFSWEDIQVKQRNLIVFWNIHNYLLDLSKELETAPLYINKREIKNGYGAEEKYILSRLHSVIEETTMLFDKYVLDVPIPKIEALFLELSRTYIQMIRDKAASGNKSEKEVVLNTIYTVLLDSLKLFAPLTPFITEKMYLDLKEAFNLKQESIHLYAWPECDERFINKKLEANMQTVNTVIQAILSARERAQLGMRWPVKNVLVVSSNEETLKTVKELEGVIKNQANVKEITARASFKDVKEVIKGDFSKLKESFDKKTPQIIAKFATESSKKILDRLKKDGKYELKVGKEKFTILREHLIVERKYPENFLETEFKDGLIYLNTERNPELDAEGYSREIMRRVQSLRKQAGLEKINRISLYLKVDSELLNMLESWTEKLKEKVGARVIKVSSMQPAKEHKHVSEEKIRGRTVFVCFDKVE